VEEGGIMTDKARSCFKTPRIHPSAYIAEDARISGDVVVEEGASIWHNAVVRAEAGTVVIGKNATLQEDARVESASPSQTRIGEGCIIARGACVRDAQIGNGSHVGREASVLPGAEIGEHSTVGPNALVPRKGKYPPRSFISGVPASRERGLTDEEAAMNRAAHRSHRAMAEEHKGGRAPWRVH
jgi:carbonic anhydrase/acetyltransferase-like protein (isoleucine patch superfamily)